MIDRFMSEHIDPDLLAAAEGEGLYGPPQDVEVELEAPRLSHSTYSAAPLAEYSMAVVAWRSFEDEQWVYSDVHSDGAEPLYAMFVKTSHEDIDPVEVEPCSLEGCEEPMISHYHIVVNGRPPIRLDRTYEEMEAVRSRWSRGTRS